MKHVYKVFYKNQDEIWTFYNSSPSLRATKELRAEVLCHGLECRVEVAFPS